jgi:hypothetical protein
VPAEIHPTELARLVDFANRPRSDGRSMRSALVRYTQPEPTRAENLFVVVRRTQGALAKQQKRIEREGEALWAALAGDGATTDADLVDLLRVARTFDELGDTLAEWARDISRPRPNDEVDRVISEVGPKLDALGVPHEQRPRGPRNRG